MYSESTGQLEEFLQIVRKRKWQILLPAIFLLCVAFAFAIIIPRKYHAQGQVEMRGVRIEGTKIFSTPDASTTSQEAANAELHLKAFERVRAVLEELGWEEYENKKDTQPVPVVNDYVRRHSDALDVSLKQSGNKRRSSAFLDVAYKNVDPERAVEFIETLVENWADELSQRDEAQILADIDDLQNRESRYKTEWREAMDDRARINKELLLLSSTDFDQPRYGPDPFAQRLADIGESLAEKESELAGMREELSALEEKIAIEPDEVAVASDAAREDAASVASSLRAQITDLRSKQQGLKPAHSRWKLLQDQIESLEEELEAAQRAPQSSVVRTQVATNQLKLQWQDRREQLEIDIARLEAVIAELARKQTDMREEAKHRAELQRASEEVSEDLRLAKEAYAEAARELREAEEAYAALVRANRQPIEWLEPPNATERPVEPNPLLIVALGLAAGLAVGLGSSMLAEFTKNCYRSVSDVTAVMTVPVLGVVNEIVTSRERRAARLRGFVVVSSSAVVLAVIAWFTWVYTVKPEILPTEVLQQVEDFRRGFK